MEQLSEAKSPALQKPLHKNPRVEFEIALIGDDLAGGHARMIQRSQALGLIAIIGGPTAPEGAPIYSTLEDFNELDSPSQAHRVPRIAFICQGSEDIVELARKAISLCMRVLLEPSSQLDRYQMTGLQLAALSVGVSALLGWSIENSRMLRAVTAKLKKCEIREVSAQISRTSDAKENMDSFGECNVNPSAFAARAEMHCAIDQIMKAWAKQEYQPSNSKLGITIVSKAGWRAHWAAQAQASIGRFAISPLGCSKRSLECAGKEDECILRKRSDELSKLYALVVKID